MARSRLRQDLGWITREGTTTCVTMGAGESSFPAYVLAASQSALASGQVATVPVFLGALLQNIAPSALRKVGSVRTWSVLMALLQACSMLALGVGSLFWQMPLWATFALISFYWATGWSIGPAWNTWMDSVVPGRLRARFFSRRQAACELVKWSSMMCAALVLSGGGNPLPVFSGLFILAGLARLISAGCMARQSEPIRLPKKYRVLGFREVLARVRTNPHARPLVYILGAQLSMQLANPFIAAFLKQCYGIGWGALMLCAAAQTFSKILVLPRIGKIAQRLGPHRLFTLSACSLAVAPLLWLVPVGSGNLLWFVLLHAYTGACLASYEMGQTLVYLYAIPAADRTSVLSRFMTFSTLAAMLGSSLGAAVLWSMPGSFAGYSVLFLLAAVARLLALKLLSPAPVRRDTVNPRLTRERRLVQHWRAEFRSLRYRPSHRSLQAPGEKRRATDKLQPYE